MNLIRQSPPHQSFKLQQLIFTFRPFAAWTCPKSRSPVKARARRSHPPRLPKDVFKIRDLYYFRYVLPKDVSQRLSKKELRLTLKTRYISGTTSRKTISSDLHIIEETRFMNLTDQQIKDLLNDYIQSGLTAEEEFNILIEKSILRKNFQSTCKPSILFFTTAKKNLH